MTIKKKFLIYFLSSFLIVLFLGSYLFWLGNKTKDQLKKEDSFFLKYEKQREICESNINGLDTQLECYFNLNDSIFLNNIKNINSKSNSLINQYIYIAISFVALFLVLMLIFLNLIVKNFLIPMKKFRKASKEIARGNLSARADIKSKDEMGELDKELSSMVDKLQDSILDVEKRVAKRTKKLDQLNKFMVGRELKMIELKKRLSDLEKNKLIKK